MNKLIALVYRKVFATPSGKRMRMSEVAQAQMQKQLTALLWSLDPFGTCCNANSNMEDEYTDLAEGVVNLVNQGFTPSIAWMRTIADAFGDYRPDPRTEPTVVAAIQLFVNQSARYS